MKKSAKLLTLLLVLALLAVGLVIGIAANEETPDAEVTYVDAVNKITEYGESLSSYSAIVYASKADFERDKKDGKLDLYDEENDAAIELKKTYAVGAAFTFYGAGVNSTDAYSKAYTYLLGDVSTDISATTYFQCLTEYAVDFGGHSLTINCESANQLYYYFDAGSKKSEITFCNGDMVCKVNHIYQLFRLGSSSVIKFENLDVIFPRDNEGNALCKLGTFIRDDGGCVDINNVNFDICSDSKFYVVARRGSTSGNNEVKGDSVTYNFENFTLNADTTDLYLYRHYYSNINYDDVYINIKGENKLGLNAQLFNNAHTANSINTNVYVKIYPGLMATAKPDFTKFVNATVGDNNEVVITYLDDNGCTSNQFRDVEITETVFGDKTVTYTKKLAESTYSVKIGDNGEPTYYFVDTISASVFNTNGAGNGVYINVFTDLDCTASSVIQPKAGSGDCVVDLNGNSLNLTPGSYYNKIDSPVDATDTLTFKNGEIRNSHNRYNYRVINSNGAGTLVFENMSLYHGFEGKVNSTQFMLLTKGTVKFIDSEIYLNTAIATGTINMHPASGETLNVTFENTVITASSVSSYGGYFTPLGIANAENSTLNLNMSGVTTTGGHSFLIYYANNAYDETMNYNVNVKDSYLGASSSVMRIMNTRDNVGALNFNVSDTYFNGNTENSDTKNAVNVNCVTLDDDYKVVEGGRQAFMAVAGNKDGYKYVVAKPTNSEVLTNLSLYSDFTLNLYVPVSNNIQSIGDYSYVVDEATKENLVVKIEGVDYYVISITDIAPTGAADKIDLAIKFTEGAETRTLNAKYSVVNYANDYLAGETTTEGTTLIMDTLAYIKAATLLATPTADVSAVNALLGNYVTGVTVPKNTATGGTNDYIESATFDIVNNVTLLKLTMKKNATVTVGGIEGVIGDDGRVSVELRAFMLANEFAIYADGNYVGTYSLASYYNSREVQANEGAKALVEALYAYAESAKAYKATV